MGIFSKVGGFVNNLLGGGGVQSGTGVVDFNQTSTLGTTGLDASTGQITSQLSPELQALFDSGIGQYGAFSAAVPNAGAAAQEQASGFLSAAGAFDPFAAAEQQFNRLDAILAPGRTEARSGGAAGLLATGRLGSTAGNRLQGEIERQIEQQRQSMLVDQFNSAQNVQDQMVNRGIALGTYGQQKQLTQQQLATGALGNAFGIDSQLQAQLGLGSQLTKSGAMREQPTAFQDILKGGAAALLAKYA